jgi:hypothetical protein
MYSLGPSTSLRISAADYGWHRIAVYDQF